MGIVGQAVPAGSLHVGPRLSALGWDDVLCSASKLDELPVSGTLRLVERAAGSLPVLPKTPVSPRQPSEMKSQLVALEAARSGAAFAPAASFLVSIERPVPAVSGAMGLKGCDRSPGGAVLASGRLVPAWAVHTCYNCTI